VWPKLRGVSAYADTNTSSATATLATPESGDLIVAWAYVTNGGPGAFAVAPAGEGWTRIVDVEDTAGTNAELSAFYKYWGAGATDTATPTFTSAGGSLSVVTETWLDVRADSPINAYSSAYGAGATTVNPADATSSAAERVSVTCAVGGQTPAGNISSINGTFYTQTFAGSSYSTTAGPDRALAGARNENIALAGSVAANGVSAIFTAESSAWASITLVLSGP
jgi:hypothetical protein